MVLLNTSAARGWGTFTGIAFILATAYYVWYASTDAAGPRGGSWPGIVYGLLGYAFMLFAGFLSLRKKLRTWPLGKTTFWMNGHIWLGLLSIPIVLFHTGFQMGSGLAMLLMILFSISILTGFYGLALQQWLPGLMLKQVKNEAIYELIPEQVEHYRREADALIETVCGPVEKGLEKKTYLEIKEGPHKDAILIFQVTAREGFSVGRNEDLPLDFRDTTLAPSHFVIEKNGDGYQVHNIVAEEEREKYPLLVSGQETDTAEITDQTLIQAGQHAFEFQEAPPIGSATLLNLYKEKIRPFLEPDPPREASTRFRTQLDVANCFNHNRKFLPPGTFHRICDELSQICEERRQLIVQQRLHRWLHGWLLFHVPASIVLIFLTLIHAVISLYY